MKSHTGHHIFWVHCIVNVVAVLIGLAVGVWKDKQHLSFIAWHLISVNNGRSPFRLLIGLNN